MRKEYDVIVIGSGASGMNVALYASRGNLKTLVLDKGMYGGQLNNTNEIDNYIGVPVQTSGQDLANLMYVQMMEFGAEHEYGEVLSVIPKTLEDPFFQVNTDIESLYARAVVIATGTQHRKLGIENEDNLSGKGISYCAICDGAFFKNKEIAVIGGGDSALEEGEFLTNYGENVSLIHRREKLRGAKRLEERFSKKENAHFILESQVTKFIGEDALTGVEITPNNGEPYIKEVSGAFVYVGLDPITEVFKPLGILNEDGYVLTNEKMETSIEGIYAVGDVREKTLRQIATAVGDGAICGTEVYNYLSQ